MGCENQKTIFFLSSGKLEQVFDNITQNSSIKRKFKSFGFIEKTEMFGFYECLSGNPSIFTIKSVGNSVIHSINFD